MSKNDKKRQPTSTTHFDITATQTFKRTMTRKNPQTGKSNYPTIYSGRFTIIDNNFFKKIKTITESNYRKIR